jgi:predicted metal-dependent enzyme (double-stranded beta helix superfamily)
MSETYTLQDLVRDARAIVGQRMSEEKTLGALKGPIERIIQRQDCLSDMPELNTNPDPERGFTIYRAENLSVMCVVWPEGGGAPVHNHNGWAMEGVISGLERNRNYARLDDGSTPWVAKLEETEPSVVGTGQTTSLSLPPNDIHAVEIPGGKTLAIHVYGIDLARQWRYQFDLESGAVTPFRAGQRRD